MTINEIETIAKETCGTLGRFFALYCMSMNEDNWRKRLLNGNNMASNFRKGKRDLSEVEYEKLMQLKADFDIKIKLKNK